ncbi:hypothetical protein VPH35_108287 [Triticum aestivum]|uniref:uncharacterized protein n=1 Tax=Triticum aestivum TaxID=4565 RepID=UPI00084446D9|nr:uncharacterized protein LOC123135566 [Triticum aestivum]XP_044410612.1 uncharacterized protein LOC123135566 [Triticum aestivum]
MGGDATEIAILESHGPQEMASLPIPDELLPEIFLRLPTPADLVRTSAACVSFRGVVTDRPFLRRYRKIHAPPLLGFLDLNGVFHPAEPPHPFTSAAEAFADFSLSFLPAPASDWAIQDIRDGRVLLGRRGVFTEFVVCDPLHRRHILLPPIPDVNQWLPSVDNSHIFLMGGDEDASDETFFRVIYVAVNQHKQVALVFSSSTGQWRATPPSIVRSPNSYWLQCAYGCLYGLTERNQKLQVLDTQRMVFSLLDLPPEARAGGSSYVHIAIVEAGEGIIGMFVLPHKTYDLSYFIKRNNGGSSSHWQLEKTISLDSSQYSLNKHSTGRKLFLYHRGSPSLVAGLFSMDVKTFQLQMVFACKYYGMLYPRAYYNFPPFLSTPIVSSGTQEQGVETPQAEEEPIDSPQYESNVNEANVGSPADVSRTGDGSD